MTACVQTDPSTRIGEAEAFINQSVGRIPDSAYMLVQSVLVQEQALQDAGARIEELEAYVQQLEAARAAPAPSSGGFLGGLFGGGKSQPAAATSVPVTNRSSGFGQSAPQGSPWGNAQAQQGGGAWGQQPMQAQAPQRSGGGFMKTAAATAAGVAGGMLAAGAIRDMMGGGGSAQAAGSKSEQTTSSEPSPYEVNQQQPQYQNPSDNDPGNTDTGWNDDSSSGGWGGGSDDEI